MLFSSFFSLCAPTASEKLNDIHAMYPKHQMPNIRKEAEIVNDLQNYRQKRESFLGLFIQV